MHGQRRSVPSRWIRLFAAGRTHHPRLIESAVKPWAGRTYHPRLVEAVVKPWAGRAPGASALIGALIPSPQWPLPW